MLTIKKELALKLATEWLIKRIKDIRSGKVIKKKYMPRTIKLRNKAGLQTSYVDITGNFMYDKKDWRLLDIKNMQLQSKGNIIKVHWIREDASIIYNYLKLKYREIIYE